MLLVALCCWSSSTEEPATLTLATAAGDCQLRNVDGSSFVSSCPISIGGSSISRTLDGLADSAAKQWRADEDLVAYLRFDEAEAASNDHTAARIRDATPYGNHARPTADGSPGSSVGSVETHAGFCRAKRWTSGSYDYVKIEDNPSTLVHEGESFTVALWVNVSDIAYPTSAIIVKAGRNCYYGPGREGGRPGWELGHGMNPNNGSLNVCLRDWTPSHNHTSGFQVRDKLWMDPPAKWNDLMHKWTHVVVVVDRGLASPSVRWFIDGVRQQHEISLAHLTAGPLYDMQHDNPLEIGMAYGWRTDGSYDEFRLYKRALSDADARALYRYRPPLHACNTTS